MDAGPDHFEMTPQRRRLANDLRDLQAPHAADADRLADLDSMILDEASRHLGGRRLSAAWRLPRRIARYAAAAALLLAAGVALHISLLPQGEPAAGDINADGRLDVIDAYRLARSLQHQDAPRGPAGRDLTGDGVIDAGDVDFVMRRIVAMRQSQSMERGPQS